MPTLTPPSRVLVTGANGFVGCWIIRRLLDGGYQVRAVVRSDDKARAISALMAKKYPGSDTTGAFETVVVADIAVVSSHLAYCTRYEMGLVQYKLIRVGWGIRRVSRWDRGYHPYCISSLVRPRRSRSILPACYSRNFRDPPQRGKAPVSRRPISKISN